MLGRLAGRAVTGPVAFLLSGVIDLAVLLAYLWDSRVPRRGGRRLQLALVALVGTAFLGGFPAASAHADTTEPMILMDDQAFIYASPAQVEANLAQVAHLGVNVVKVSVVWSLVAPDPNATTEPQFDASDPSAYPAGAWARYDRVVNDAKALGLRVYFQLTAPAPLWAINPHNVPGYDHNWSHEPNPRLFGQFVTAVAKRYSGSYVPGAASSAGAGSSTGASGTGGGVLGPITGTITSPTSTPPANSGAPLPAVTMWGIWNEPNERGWLSPQVLRVHGHNEPRAAEMVRALYNAGYRALAATGHASDTILIGETASGGDTRVIPFLRELYCVGPRDQPLTGQAAALIDCPTSGNRRSFVIDNPGLFAISGWAHHPYSFSQTPALPFRNAPWVITMANLGVLERNLDRIDSAYREPTGLPLYLTEWGYMTNPPNPYVHTTLGEQETWLDEGYYMSYEMPRVKAMAQFELYDSPPVVGARPGSVKYWSNFESGLEYLNGHPKPAYAAFRLPIWLPSQRPGRRVLVWMQIRPAQVAGNRTGVLEFLPAGTSRWRSIARVTTSSPEGFILTHVNIPGRGSLRLAWADPATRAIYFSRTVPITSGPDRTRRPRR
ncbi:hypothetical protein [Conexibacter sp. DBS9H8]|uniref:hypothetical protein n=1 Tax=Conexibacter sp. DBS9H8 TaxID=2937801 RepID=UPI00200BF1FE|nr:hypothetical protein [Conexibacter sp. DBS9H8]